MMVFGNVASFVVMAMADTAMMFSCAAAIGSSGGMMVLAGATMSAAAIDSSDGNSTCGMRSDHKLTNPLSNMASGAMMFSCGMAIDSTDGISSTGVCRLRPGHMVVYS